MLASLMQSQLLPILGAIVAFLFAAVLSLYIFRMLFGRRVKAPGPRNRPRRLDVVDAFDLDRERQLVIVRRDNVEHLLMIGGPNDVVIEASINRLEGRDMRTTALREAPREKEAAAGAAWPAPPAPQGPLPVAASQAAEAAPAALPQFAEPAKRSAPAEAGPPAPPAGPLSPGGLPPLPPDLFAPAPSKPAPAPEAPAPLARPAPKFAPPPLRPGFTPLKPPPRPPATSAFAARFRKPSETVPEEAHTAAQAPQEPAPAAHPSPAPPPPREPQPQPEPPLAKVAEAADPLDSLEAEMARLLGRPEPGKK